MDPIIPNFEDIVLNHCVKNADSRPHSRPTGRDFLGGWKFAPCHTFVWLQRAAQAKEQLSAETGSEDNHSPAPVMVSTAEGAEGKALKSDLRA